MANLTHRDPPRSGVAGLPRSSTSDDTPRDGLVGIDDELREEMSRLAAANSDLMKSIRARHESTDEVSKLRAENADLRRRLEGVEELVAALADGDTPTQAAPWEERQREYESLLEEKSEVIRALHQKIQELQEEGGEALEAPRDRRANADMDEVEQLRAKLIEERQRLQDDEEALMVQMREMEMAMSRDRAELSRQRNELQRIHSDIMREVEQAGRDTGLRDRLLAMARRPQDASRPKTMMSISLPDEQALPAEAPKKKNSGLFRRLFGG
jgi:chromosome segregation ATPase